MHRRWCGNSGDGVYSGEDGSLSGLVDDVRLRRSNKMSPVDSKISVTVICSLPVDNECNWGEQPIHICGGWSRLAADRVTYSGIGYLQPLRRPLGILPPILDIVSALGKFVLHAIKND
jgi:hypothetical protein